MKCVYQNNRYRSNFCLTCHNRKISRLAAEAHKTRIITDENRRHLSESHIGKKQSEEQKRKRRLKLIGRKITWVKKIMQTKIKNQSFRHSVETRRNMSKARLYVVYPHKDTTIEKILQELLTSKSIEFKTHFPILGQPDIFIEPNICIFADGDYWHGRLTQIKKDSRITSYLESKGYKVLRLWEYDIRNNIKWIEKIISLKIV